MQGNNRQINQSSNGYLPLLNHKPDAIENEYVEAVYDKLLVNAFKNGSIVLIEREINLGHITIKRLRSIFESKHMNKYFTPYGERHKAHGDMLSWALRTFIFSSDYITRNHCILYACALDKLDSAKMISEFFTSVDLIHSAYRYATNLLLKDMVEKGQLDALQWLNETFDISGNIDDIRFAPVSKWKNQLAMSKWVLQVCKPLHTYFPKELKMKETGHSGFKYALTELDKSNNLFRALKKGIAEAEK